MRPHAYSDLGERDTLPGIIARRAREIPERTYLTDITAGASLTFEQAHSRILTWADALRHAGVAPGERVGVMLPNSIDAVCAWLGTAWIRGYEVALNTAFRGELLKYFLNYTGISIAIVSERFLPRFAEISDEIPDLRTIIVPDATAPPIAVGKIKMLTRRDFLDGAQPAHELNPPEPHDIMSIAYTSGTTGPSKGVMLPWGMFTLGVALLDDLGPDDAFYSPFPMFHMSGKGAIAQAAYMKGRDVFRESFDTGSFWKDIDDYRCTFTLLVPAMAHWLLRSHRRGTISATRCERCCPPRWCRVSRKGLVSVRTHYGMTEVGNVMSRLESTTLRRAAGVHCRAMKSAWLMSTTTKSRPECVGELAVRTHDPWQICAGYWNLPEKTAESLAQRLVPYRRRIRCDAEELLFRRSQEGCAAPARREHFLLRNRGPGSSAS